MDFGRSQTDFVSLGQWHAWRLGLDLAIPRPNASPEEATFQGFLRDLYTDLFANPTAYGIPHVAYELTRRGDKAREDRLREGRLKIRRATENGLLDSYYQIGQVGEVDGDVLRLARPTFEQLLAEKARKNQIRGLPQSFERLGMSFAVDEVVHVSHPRYPGLMTTLSTFAKACAIIPVYGFYFFRRGDFAVCDGKRLPTFKDGLALISDGLAGELQTTDELLAEFKFKRELFSGDSGDAGYRMRYQKKKGRITYWSRIRAWSSFEHDHILRWDFDGDLTTQLFERLDSTHPGLVGNIFEGIVRCAHCFENCNARKQLTYGGETHEVCQVTGWETIGDTATDFQNLRTVLTTLDELASPKK